MAMSDIAFQPFTDFSQIPVSEDGLFDDHDYTLSPQLDHTLDYDDYSPIADSRHIHRKTSIARQAQMQQRLSTLTKSAAGNPSYSPGDIDPHGSPYCFGNIPIQSDLEPQPFLQLQRTRYDSPSGSCGGDRSVTDSSPSETSWPTPRTYPDSQAFYSPVPEYLQYTDSFESQCGSDSSVSPQDVLHYPDPVPEQGSAFDDRVALDNAPRSVPIFFSQPTQNLDIQFNPVEQMFGNHPEETNGPVDPALDNFYNNNSEECSQGARIGTAPRKRTKYNYVSSEGSSSPSPPTSSSFLQKANDSRRHNNKPKQKHSPVKRNSGRRGALPVKGNHSNATRKTQASINRVFPCTFAQYGCGSSFGSKNEWKRHVLSQHLQLGFYRCDLGHCNVAKRLSGSSSSSPTSCPYSFPNCTSPSPSPSSPSMSPYLVPTLRTPNDFNRKDLFTQHLRRMHAPWLTVPSPREPTKEEREAFDKSLDEVRQRCWTYQRSAPQRSQCSYCEQEFSGPHCWEDRMEHVGKHCEHGDIATGEDLALRDWAAKEGVIKSFDTDKWVLTSILNGHGKKSWDYSALREQ